MLIVGVSKSGQAAITPHLGLYATSSLEQLVEHRCSVRPLRASEGYRDASTALRRLGVDVDNWPVPPAGVFVVGERTVDLRSLTAMTIGHEVAHAIDCTLGGGVYRSGFDPFIRAAYAAARAFETPYAATGLDEYLAESVRAYAGVFNHAVSPWPAANARALADVRSHDA